MTINQKQFYMNPKYQTKKVLGGDIYAQGREMTDLHHLLYKGSVSTLGSKGLVLYFLFGGLGVAKV
jgi:hypothetical protein